jgi:hypothetical protein
MDANHPDLGKAIMETHELSPENEQKLEDAVRQFKQTVSL